MSNEQLSTLEKKLSKQRLKKERLTPKDEWKLATKLKAIIEKQNNCSLPFKRLFRKLFLRRLNIKLGMPIFDIDEFVCT